MFTGKYWMDNIRCSGEESEISECRFDSWGENDCDPSEAAGVVCGLSESKPHTLKSIPSTSQPDVLKKIQKYRIKVITFLLKFKKYFSI